MATIDIDREMVIKGIEQQSDLDGATLEELSDEDLSKLFREAITGDDVDDDGDGAPIPGDSLSGNAADEFGSGVVQYESTSSRGSGPDLSGNADELNVDDFGSGEIHHN